MVAVWVAMIADGVESLSQWEEVEVVLMSEGGVRETKTRDTYLGFSADDSMVSGYND